MKTKTDNILLIILWLLAATLGTCFWLNIRFGFNIFTLSHWKYLSYVQASGGHINIWFYVSIALSIAITITGLYIIAHPNFARIAKRGQNIKNATPSPDQQLLLPAPTSDDSEAPQRPQHLGHSNLTQPRPTPQFTPTITPQPIVKTTSPDLSTQMAEIFNNAGYTTKKAPKINGVQMNLFAAGTNEVLWMGADGISGVQMSNAIDKIRGVFSDSLDDVEITINAFIISPTDTPTNNILAFSDISDLENYINAHPNPPLPNDDDGNFDAYSEYISTVAEYIGNI